MKALEIINEFLEPFGCHAKLGKAFETVLNEHLISFSIDEPDEGEKEFFKSLYELHKPKVSCDIFLWSLLHEIGHNETLSKTSSDNWENYKNLRKQIISGKVPPYAYYYHTIEWLASEWAVNYANTHFEELTKFWNKLHLALDKVHEV